MAYHAGVSASSQVDLTSCDREPIHHINAVQPFGFLVAVSREWVIVRVSLNAADQLGLSVDALLGAPLSTVIKSETLHVIRNKISSPGYPDAVERSFAVQLQADGPRYDLAIHVSGQTIVIEAEPHLAAGELNAGAMVRSMLARMEGKADLVREAARLLQALTGFDRVMIYRFHPDGSGEVIAERVQAGMPPYLGLRYPAEDIPQQARALLVRNPVRLLVDVDAEPSPLMPDMPAAPLDLSMSTLRAHSVMHIEYLRNMGVGATMTVSLLRGGKLWGLISCHHRTPHHVGFEQRTTAELFARMLSFMIEERERAEATVYDAHTRQLGEQLTAAVIERGSAAETIAELATGIAGLVPCDGVAIYIRGHVTLTGKTPTPTECAALQGFLDTNAAGRIFGTEELARVYPPAQAFLDRSAGMLVLPISRAPGDYLVFFRRELAQTIRWAGEPVKTIVHGPSGSRLTPRKSFEAWQESVRGRSAPWTQAELSAAEAMRVTVLETVLQIAGRTEAESRAATQKQELLIAELNHRVRNILGLIRGLVAQSRTSARDVDTFATLLGDRVHALARAHDQITAKNWGPSSLADLIATEAGAFLGENAVRISCDGPPVLLQPHAFSTIALVVHELMTNAAKHGALVGPTGQVTIAWRLEEDGSLIVDWQENGGPPTKAPVRRGFGSTIIHRSIPHELGGEATLDFVSTGLRARFVVPGSYVVRDVAALIVPPISIKRAPEARLSGTVLLVEDNIVIALEAEDLLMGLGADNVLVAGSVAEAMRLLASETPSFALLDINLGSERSWPVASRLLDLGVHFAFATGYGDGIDYPAEHRSAPSITKPYTAQSVASVIA